MTKFELESHIRAKQSYLCVGLDTDMTKIPPHLLGAADPIFAFNKAIIDATRDYCVAYKPNIAFYEALGTKGWQSLERTMAYIPKTHFTIADAKRGDIGNTSRLYAKAFFETMNFDAITVAPYMGADSVLPFLEYDQKWVILLGLTSNVGSHDFQMQQLATGELLYEKVLRTAQTWGTAEQLMFVAGATHPEKFKELRAIAPDSFFLVPGIGAQGGDLAAVSQNGMNSGCGLLVNSSREIIYAASGENFAEAAAEKAKMMQQAMSVLLGA
jgi:orotidine-5'-phosphate decarboxylase